MCAGAFLIIDISAFSSHYEIIRCICHNFSQTRNLNRAEALVREMEEEGIDAPIDIYHTMMDGYTMILKEEKCVMVFGRLKVNAY